MNPKQLVEQFIPVAEKCAGQLATRYAKILQKRLLEYKSLSDEFLKISISGLQGESSSLQYWESIEAHLRGIREWTMSLPPLAGEFSAEDVLGNWRGSFREIQGQLPEMVRLEIPDEFWQANASDKSATRIWKSIRRTGKKINSIRQSITNSKSKSSKESAHSSGSSIRYFNLSLFLEKELKIVISGFLVREYFHFLRTGAMHLERLHQLSESLKDKALVLEDFKKVCAARSPITIGTGREINKHYAEALQQIIAETAQYQLAAGERFHSMAEELKEEFLSRWDIAGTFMLPERKFGFHILSRMLRKLDEQMAGGRQAWEKHLLGEREEWQKDLELSILQLLVADHCLDTIQILERKINQKIVPVFEETKELISESFERFTGKEISDADELRTLILTENRKMLKILRQEKLSQMMDAMVHANLDQTFRGFILRIRNAVEILSEEHSVFRIRDMEETIPHSRIDDVPLKALVREEILTGLSKTYQIFTNGIHARLELISRTINEIDQIVEFNLEAALTLLKQETKPETVPKAQHVVIEGLERARSHVAELISTLQQVHEDTENNLPDMILIMETKIQDIADNEKILELKLRWARAKARQELRIWRSRIWKATVNFFPAIMSRISGYIERFRTGYSIFRRFTSLAPLMVQVDEKLTQYLTKIYQKTNRLPFVYQRLFRLEPLTDNRFYSGREEEMEILKSAFARWSDHQASSVAVVGERGSGKTTLLNFALQDVFVGFPIIKIDFQKTIYEEAELLETMRSSFKKLSFQNLSELDKQLGSGPKTVCQVENLHNLFIRTVNGFDALEHFLLFLSKTQNQVFWIVSCGLYGWQYLDKVMNISKYFLNIIALDAISDREMQTIILKRHRVSGYKLRFETSPELLKSHKFKRLTSEISRQSFLENRFFEKLAELSAGNISAAILFWLGAIKSVSRDEMLLEPGIELDHTFLYQLPPDELFTLAILIQHEILNASECAMVFRQHSSDSVLILNRMLNRGFLQEDERGYRVHPLLYRPVIRALKSKKILH